MRLLVCVEFKDIISHISKNPLNLRDFDLGLEMSNHGKFTLSGITFTEEAVKTFAIEFCESLGYVVKHCSLSEDDAVDEFICEVENVHKKLKNGRNSK